MKDEELLEIPEPIGKFIIDNAKGVAGGDGVYYHYAEVCKLLKLYAKKIQIELEENKLKIT